MIASQYGSTNIIHINAKDIMYIIKDGYECKTCLSNGMQISLSLKEMRDLLDKMPRVFSYEFYLPVFLNPKQIFSYSTNGIHVNVEFNNGKSLKELSKIHFYKNVVPKIEKEREL